MKKSTEFWIVIGIIGLIGLNYLMFKYPKITDIGLLLVYMNIILADIILICLGLSKIIPKFNNWLDR